MLSQERFLGWYVDGEWAVKARELTFLNSKAKAALATNNLVIKSQRIEFVYDFKVQQSVGAKSESGAAIRGREVLAFSVSPAIYDIKTFDAQQTLMHSHGIVLYLLKNDAGHSGVFLRQFPLPTTFDVREVLSLSKDAHPTTWCHYDCLNKTTNLNLTLDFDSGTLHVRVNDQHCVSHRLDPLVFPSGKATTSMFGFSTEESQVALTMNEISVFKQVALAAVEEGGFTDSLQEALGAFHEFDKNHLLNNSLSNLLVMEVR